MNCPLSIFLVDLTSPAAQVFFSSVWGFVYVWVLRILLSSSILKDCFRAVRLDVVSFHSLIPA